MKPTKEHLQKYYRQALDRCLAAFGSLSEEDWRKRASKVWTAKDYLAHVVSSHEQGCEGPSLIRQALAGQLGELPGYAGREHTDEYNEQLLSPLRDLPAAELLTRLQTVCEDHLGILEGLSEADLDKPATNPGWDRPGTVRDLFAMSYLHLPAHYQDIRRAAKKKLPHWTQASSSEEVHFQLDRTFHFMPLIFWSSRGGDMNATYGFTMEGEGGGQWAIHIADGRAEAQEGPPEKADSEIRTQPALWMDLSTNDLNAAFAIMTRKVHIGGNPALAMRLENLFQAT